MQLRGQLTAQQSIVTKDGIWLGKTWLRVTREKDNKRGVLAREQELHNIKQELMQQAALETQLEENIVAANANLHALEVTLSDKQQLEAEISAKLRDSSNKHTAAQQKLEHTLNRRQRIEVEITEQMQNLQLTGEEATTSRTKLEIAIEAMAEFAVQKDQIMHRREQAIAREKTTKLTAKELQENLHSLEISKQTVFTKLQGLQHTISRVDQQLAELHKRHQQLLQSLQDDVSPENNLQLELEELLAQRLAIESDLQQARAELEVYTTQMREYEQQRANLEKAAAEIKDVLDQAKLERQTLDVRKETINEQLVANNIDVQQVITQLPADAEDSAWQERIETLHKKITNLGRS